MGSTGKKHYDRFKFVCVSFLFAASICATASDASLIGRIEAVDARIRCIEAGPLIVRAWFEQGAINGSGKTWQNEASLVIDAKRATTARLSYQRTYNLEGTPNYSVRRILVNDLVVPKS